MAGLKKHEDAFGQGMYDYLLGVGGFNEVIERDDGYIDVGSGSKMYFAEYKKWPAHDRKGIRCARGRVLDIGCGAGRCLLHLQNKGHEVVGIDNSPLAIEVCRKRGAKKALVRSINEIGPDMGRFDTIVMYGNNFGLFGSYSKAKRLLRRMHRMTTDKARLIVQSMNPYQTDEPDHLAYHKINQKRGRMSGQTRLRVRYKKIKTPYFEYLFVSPDEMADILKGTGWKAARFIHSPKVPHYIAIIEKEM